MVIDNWFKWGCLAVFSFLNTAVNEFLGSALVPWFTNTIMDHKSTAPFQICLFPLQSHSIADAFVLCGR